MDIEIFLIFISFFILYVLLESYLEEYKEVKIIFLGLIISSFFYVLSKNVNEAFLSEIFNILTIVSLLMIIILVIYNYINKLGNDKNNL